ncbi:hypothetical protein CLOM_g11122 [Closterium sp. NIES-68]|nr:hypothetical protein CLOM_g11122 [Closterium sp. NIES-68]GJP75272.1 hypothetical protein CLOP_g5727 [Closterium sp. NIES-67]
MMRWVEHASTMASGDPPSARSGHVAVLVKRSKLVLFGGLQDKDFLDDVLVLDTVTNEWTRPVQAGAGEAGHGDREGQGGKEGKEGEGTGQGEGGGGGAGGKGEGDGARGGGSEGEGGGRPCARAFHAAAAIEGGNLFVFGGRTGKKRLGDFWMLDTDTWQWAQLPCGGTPPCPRDFASLVAFGSSRLILHGGWDGTRFLNDTYILDTMSLEWQQVLVPLPASLPPPRCGHTAAVFNNRLLVFGGRGTGGAMLNDLWTLKGIDAPFAPQPQLPGTEAIQGHWTQLKLPGNIPSARCGHSGTLTRTQMLVFGGHCQAGWLTRTDMYANDIAYIDRATVQWKQLTTAGGPPAPRAYHTVTAVGSRFVCVGGFDGKTTFGDVWWLVPADDPWAVRDEQLCSKRVALEAAIRQASAVAGGMASPSLAPAPAVAASALPAPTFGLLPSSAAAAAAASAAASAARRFNDSLVAQILAPAASAAAAAATVVVDAAGAVGAELNKAAEERELLHQLSDLHRRVGLKSPSLASSAASHAPASSLPSLPLAGPAVDDAALVHLGRQVMGRAGEAGSAASTGGMGDTADRGVTDEAGAGGMGESAGDDVAGGAGSGEGEGLGGEEKVGREAEGGGVVAGGAGRASSSPSVGISKAAAVEAARAHLVRCEAAALRMRDVAVMLADYQRQVAIALRHESTDTVDCPPPVHVLYHLRSANQLRLSDVPRLQFAYSQLLHSNHAISHTNT